MRSFYLFLLTPSLFLQPVFAQNNITINWTQSVAPGQRNTLIGIDVSTTSSSVDNTAIGYQAGNSNGAFSGNTVKMAYASDTVQAIRQLFADKRGNARYTTNVGLLTAGVGGVVLVPTLAVVYAIGSLFRSSPDPGRVAAFSLKLLSPGLGIITLGLVNRSRFSKKREEAIVLAYLEGQPLPPVIRRKLRRTHFGTGLP